MVRAVAAGVLVEVLLVVVLGVVERGRRCVRDLRLDLAVSGLRQHRLVHRQRRLGDRSLLGVGDDDRPVLGPDIVALAHGLGGIVVLPEGLQERLVRDASRVVGDQDHLGVPGLAGAGLSIRRVRRGTAGVADRRRHDAGELPEILLVAPEAAKAEDRSLVPSGHGPAIGVPRTVWMPGVMIGAERPGRASVGSGMDAGLDWKNLMPAF